MTKSPFLALLALAGSVFAQGLQTPAAAIMRATSFAALPTIYSAPGAISWWDQRPFTFDRTFGWIAATPVDFLPEFTTAPSPRPLATGQRPQPAPGGLADLLPKVDYAGGEFGFFFGKSIDGRVDLERKGGYILGEIASGRTQLNVGAWYERTDYSH